MFDTIGGRRFALSALATLGAFVLALLGAIDGNAYMLTTVGLVGAYVAGNTTQKVKGPASRSSR